MFIPVKPVPKPRKLFLLKRSATVNLAGSDESERKSQLKRRSVSNEQVEFLQHVGQYVEQPDELPCTCPKSEETKCAPISERAPRRFNHPTEGSVESSPAPKSRTSMSNFPRPLGLMRQKLAIIDEQLSSSSSREASKKHEFSDISLLDQLQKTRPIWFLEKVDRFAACHLLRTSEPGTFIVRSSSSQQQYMALSVRMKENWPVEIEHYLIERAENGIRLEGSQDTFPSIIELVINYILNGEEIQGHLQLPNIIRTANSTLELDRLALLGQDFWRCESEMARPGSVFMSKQSNDPVALKMSQSMHGLAAQQHEDEHSAPEFHTEPQRRSTMRLGMNALRHDYYSPPIYDSWTQKKRPPIQMGVASGMLKKSYSAYGIAAAPSDDESSSPYSGGRSLKVKSKRPANFLRNLFSTNDQGGKKANKHDDLRQPRIITQSDYFMPKTLNDQNGSHYWTPQVPDRADISDEWNCEPVKSSKHRKPVERLLSASSVGRRLKAFRSTGGECKQCTKDDMFSPKVDVDEARHQILRRQNTDLCASRLANFTPFTSTVTTPTIQHKQIMPEHRRFHTGPIVPPHSGRISNNSMQNCIDELRRKREANGSTSSGASSLRTEDEKQQEASPKGQTDRPTIALRSQDRHLTNGGTPSRDLNSRLSVPNLSARELNGDSRIPIAGELQTINEGLITPVVRRKYINGTQRQVVKIPPEGNNSNEVNCLPKHSRASSAEQASNTLTAQQRTQRQLAESLAAELNHLARNTKLDSSKTPISNQKIPVRKTQTEELPTFVHKIQPWTAVNRELKSRQLQIAKIKPQPVARTRQQPSLANGQKLNMDSAQTTPKIMDTVEIKPENEVSELENGGVSSEVNDPIMSIEENKPDQEDDDVVSVAGTVFNEPWDSNALENLMEIAQFCDERPSKIKAKGAFMECCTHETIAEEEDNCSYCGSVSTTSISPYSHVSRNAPSPTHNSNSDVEVHQVSLSPEDNTEDVVFGMERPRSSDLGTNGMLDMTGNTIWNEMSKRVPSEQSTLNSQKDNRSRSMLNVASDHMASPMVERHNNFRLRTQTPNFNESLESFNCILPAASPARLRTCNKNTDPGQRIQNFIEKLALDSNNTFGASLQCFIECTIDSDNVDPRLSIRNARQFITGIKNFLINGETIQEVIEQESAKLQSNEFLNIDSILETVLHKIVLVPIKRHIYHLFCRESIRNASFETLTNNLSLVRTFSMDKLGLPSNVKTPDMKQLELVRKYMRKAQNHYSPLKKFENILSALSLLVRRADSFKKLPCTDVIRWFVYLLAKTSCVTCEIEAWYMWEMLPTQLLTTGHVIYYLSTFFSAIHILKNSDSIERLRYVSEHPSVTTIQENLQSCINEAADGYFRCAIPNENLGTIEFRIFPLIAQLNVQRLCQIIANQLSISNNEEYGLFVLYDGYETPLHNNEFPLTVRTDLNVTGKAHFFAYKRVEAKIAWPSSTVQLTSSASLNQPIQGTVGGGGTQSRYI